MIGDCLTNRKRNRRCGVTPAPKPAGNQEWGIFAGTERLSMALELQARSVSFEVALFAALLLAKGHIQRSQGQRPWKLTRNKSIWPTAIINPSGPE